MLGPLYHPMQKNGKKIAGADFIKIPFFSKWLLVVIFAFLSHMVNLVFLIAPDQVMLEGWGRSHLKGP